MIMIVKQCENDVKNDISQWLAWNRIPHRRQNSGGFGGEYKGKKRFYKFIMWLWPKKSNMVALDIHGWYRGRYFEVELKATGKKPTDEQWKTIYYLRDQGQVSFYADSRDMFIEKWGEWFK